MIVPTSTVNLLTEQALSAALSLGETVVAVAVAGDEDECERIKRDWDEWNSGGPDRGAARPPSFAGQDRAPYIESIKGQDATITVLIPEIIPGKRRHEILHNQRGRLLEAVLKARTDVVDRDVPVPHSRLTAKPAIHLRTRCPTPAVRFALRGIRRPTQGESDVKNRPRLAVLLGAMLSSGAWRRRRWPPAAATATATTTGETVS